MHCDWAYRPLPRGFTLPLSVLALEVLVRMGKDTCCHLTKSSSEPSREVWDAVLSPAHGTVLWWGACPLLPQSSGPLSCQSLGFTYHLHLEQSGMCLLGWCRLPGVSGTETHRLFLLLVGKLRPRGAGRASWQQLIHTGDHTHKAV